MDGCPTITVRGSTGNRPSTGPGQTDAGETLALQQAVLIQAPAAAHHPTIGWAMIQRLLAVYRTISASIGVCSRSMFDEADARASATT